MIQSKHLQAFIFISAAFMAFSGCGKSSEPAQAVLGKNLVTAGNPSEDKIVGEQDNQFRVVARGKLQSGAGIVTSQSVEGKAFLEKITGRTGSSSAQSSSGTPETIVSTDPTDLVVGIPVGLIGEQYVLDGVITKVSDVNNTDLGDLKLTDLTPIHVKTELARDAAGNYKLELLGCTQNCTESTPLTDVQDFPVVAVDAADQLVIIDLATVAKDFDLMAQLDPDGSALHLKTVSTRTTAFDYSMSTLVFDVESHMIPAKAKATDPGVQETVFTSRWSLRLSSAFNPAFESRPATDGVGFFLTQRNAETKIQRWSTTSEAGVAPVHYFIKNVPAEYQAAFKSAFDEWNAKLKPVLGKEIFSYEFVAADDPRNALLVPGDPRFNIVEWDLVNKASYGGLGPSIANQFTGENMTANVLIQGPTIEQLYKDWFKVNKQAQELREEGQTRAADVLLIESRHEIFDKLDDLANRPKLSLSKGELKFTVHSQRPELADPVAQRNDFDPLPASLDYDKYMYGYFHDMLTHELGHNLGLRHNFKGNLGSTGDGDTQVSRSVMEYLSRDYRYLDHVDEYDLMALSYGYTGKQPGHTDWFCTDEDGVENDPVKNSAECTSNDATANPFDWYQMRLGQAIDYLINRGNKDAPTWTVDDMARELGIAVKGLGYYITSADATFATWTNFPKLTGRPASSAAMKAFVISKVKSLICDSSLDLEASLKATPQAQAKTADNVTALRAKVAELLTGIKAPVTADELKCASPSSLP